MYLNDYDDTFALSIYYHDIKTKEVAMLYDTHAPYLKDKNVWNCPADSEPQRLQAFFDRCRVPFRAAVDSFSFSYVGNMCLFAHGKGNVIFGEGARPARKLSTIVRPADQSLFSDGRILCNGDTPFFDPGEPASPSTQKPPWHGDGVNVAYVDGHTGFQKARLKPGGFWVADQGPFDDRVTLWGLVGKEGKYVGCNP